MKLSAWFYFHCCFTQSSDSAVKTFVVSGKQILNQGSATYGLRAGSGPPSKIMVPHPFYKL